MSPTNPAAVVVLAAGEGTRMKSAVPKVLHEICGRSLLGHVVAAARELAPRELVVVVGHEGERVAAHLAGADPRARVAVQAERHGTGHAVRTALEALAAESVALDGTVVITCGDTPLLTAGTLSALVAAHERGGNAVTVLTAEVPDATGYGRVVREPDGSVAAIVEQKDADPAQCEIREINSGVFAFEAKALAEALSRLTRENAQGEEYLTDALAILRAAGRRVGAAVAADHEEVAGVNNRVQLARARRSLNDRLLRDAMLAGATVVDPASTWVDVTVEFAPDCLVLPGTTLRGATRLAAGAEVGPHSQLTDTAVGEGARVAFTVADGAEIGPEANVGPYAYLRPGTRLARAAKAGTYVEMKNASIGEGSKVPHLSYVGDATIGDHTNIGAASVFVNYDGEHKHHSRIGSHCRTGADNMFVAPVTIGDGVYTAAGSVIVKDVPPGALAVARGQQRNIDGWVTRKRSGSAAAKAAERAGRGE